MIGIHAVLSIAIVAQNYNRKQISENDNVMMLEQKHWFYKVVSKSITNNQHFPNWARLTSDGFSTTIWCTLFIISPIERHGQSGWFAYFIIQPNYSSQFVVHRKWHRHIDHNFDNNNENGWETSLHRRCTIAIRTRCWNLN